MISLTVCLEGEEDPVNFQNHYQRNPLVTIVQDTKETLQKKVENVEGEDEKVVLPSIIEEGDRARAIEEGPVEKDAQVEMGGIPLVVIGVIVENVPVEKNKNRKTNPFSSFSFPTAHTIVLYNLDFDVDVSRSLWRCTAFVFHKIFLCSF
jgi:hypothetical protein